MKLRRLSLEEAGFTSAALVVDDEIQDRKGTTIALVLYHPEGCVVYRHRPEYEKDEQLLRVLVEGEKYIFDTWRAGRFKVFDVVGPS